MFRLFPRTCSRVNSLAYISSWPPCWFWLCSSLSLSLFQSLCEAWHTFQIPELVWTLSVFFLFFFYFPASHHLKTCTPLHRSQWRWLSEMAPASSTQLNNTKQQRRKKKKKNKKTKKKRKKKMVPHASRHLRKCSPDECFIGVRATMLIIIVG